MTIFDHDNWYKLHHQYNMIKLFNNNDNDVAIKTIGKKKCLSFIRGYKCCHEAFKHWLEYPPNTNIVLIAIGEFMYKMVKSYFGHKFTIMQTSYDDRIELMVNSAKKFGEMKHNRSGICGAHPLYPGAFDKLPQNKFLEDMNINFFKVNNNKRQLDLLHNFSQYKASMDMRDECNKSYLDSISIGTPMLCRQGARLLAPNIYKHDFNLKEISIFDFESVATAMKEISQIDNKQIQNQFFIDAAKAKTDMLNMLNSLDLENFITMDDYPDEDIYKH